MLVFARKKFLLLQEPIIVEALGTCASYYMGLHGRDCVVLNDVEGSRL